MQLTSTQAKAAKDFVPQRLTLPRLGGHICLPSIAFLRRRWQLLVPGRSIQGNPGIKLPVAVGAVTFSLTAFGEPQPSCPAVRVLLCCGTVMASDPKGSSALALYPPLAARQVQGLRAYGHQAWPVWQGRGETLEDRAATSQRCPVVHKHH